MPEKEIKYHFLNIARISALLLAFFAPTIIFFARHSPPLLLIIFALVLFVQLYCSSGLSGLFERCKFQSKQLWFKLMIALMAFILLSAAWSPVPSVGIYVALQTFAAILIGLFLVAVCSELEMSSLRMVLFAGVIVSAAILAYDSLTVFSVRYTFTNGRLSDSNRIAVLIAIIAPLILTYSLDRKRFWMIGLAGVALAGISAFSSVSQSAMFVFVVALLAVAVVWFGGNLISRNIGWLSVLFVVLAPLIYASVLDVMPSFVFKNSHPGTVEARAFIWSAYGALVPSHPIIGYGLHASSVAHLTPEASSFSPERIKWLLTAHPHGIPLQIWYEQGLLGALFLAVTIYAVVFKAAESSHINRVAEMSFFVGVFTISAISHGAWQAWWPSLVAIAAMGLPTIGICPKNPPLPPAAKSVS